MLFKPYQTQSTVLVVDDDGVYLEVAKTILTQFTPRVIAFASPEEALERLIQDNETLKLEEQRLDAALNAESPAISLRLSMGWLNDPDRHKLVEVAFIDQVMPRMQGLQLLEKLSSSRIRRCLLTSMATEEVAVEAFNAGLIDGYINKTSSTLVADLESMIRRGPRFHALTSWSGLDPVMESQLNQTACGSVLQSWLREHEVLEYLLLPSPSGLLCRTAQGKDLWLQFETPQTRRGALEVLGAVPGVRPCLLDDIASGRMSVAIELADACRLGEDAMPTAPTVQIDAVHGCTMAAFDITPEMHERAARR